MADRELQNKLQQHDRQKAERHLAQSMANTQRDAKSAARTGQSTLETHISCDNLRGSIEALRDDAQVLSTFKATTELLNQAAATGQQALNTAPPACKKRIEEALRDEGNMPQRTASPKLML